MTPALQAKWKVYRMVLHQSSDRQRELLNEIHHRCRFETGIWSHDEQAGLWASDNTPSPAP